MSERTLLGMITNEGCNVKTLCLEDSYEMPEKAKAALKTLIETIGDSVDVVISISRKELPVSEPKEEEQSDIDVIRKEIAGKKYWSDYLGMDCDLLANAIDREKHSIERLIEKGNCLEAVMRFFILCETLCERFIRDSHWNYFDDMYSPDYSVKDIFEYLKKQRTNGKIDDTSWRYLADSWKGIEQTEAYSSYGILHGMKFF